MVGRLSPWRRRPHHLRLPPWPHRSRPLLGRQHRPRPEGRPAAADHLTQATTATPGKAAQRPSGRAPSRLPAAPGSAPTRPRCPPSRQPRCREPIRALPASGSAANPPAPTPSASHAPGPPADERPAGGFAPEARPAPRRTPRPVWPPLPPTDRARAGRRRPTARAADRDPRPRPDPTRAGPPPPPTTLHSTPGPRERELVTWPPRAPQRRPWCPAPGRCGVAALRALGRPEEVGLRPA
ncbi:MAG: hypothetical protein QOJ19_3934 [Acidimicrobiia bacterium]|nr:hypothetical protein [Acidimicrobiia bacterium]